MRFKVTKQYGRGPESIIATFADSKDAKLFAATKVEEDTILRVAAIYRITEFDEVIAEFDSTKPTVTDESATSSSTGQQSTQRFSPSPLPTAPRPPGMPQNWRNEPTDDNSEDK